MTDSAGVGDIALQILNSNAMTPTNPGGKASGIPDISDEAMAALGIDTSRIGLEGMIQETTSVGQVGVNSGGKSSSEEKPQLGLPGMETVPYLDKKKPSTHHSSQEWVKWLLRKEMGLKRRIALNLKRLYVKLALLLELKLRKENNVINRPFRI